MRPILFTIPLGDGIPVFGFGLALFLAFLGSTRTAARCARRHGLDEESVLDLALWVFVGGLIGARIFYVTQYWGTRVHSLADVFRFWEGGIVLYGSIIGGTITYFTYQYFRPFPVRPTLDAVAPALAIGVGIGRLGCFLNGCCFGDTCALPVGVAFPAPSAPWVAHVEAGLIGEGAAYSLPVHPTQLYAVIDGFVLLALLLAYYPLRRRDGEVMALLMVTYPVTRFLVEYLRNDEKAMFLGMTVSQNISLFLLVAGIAFWRYLAGLPEGRYADGVAEALGEPAAAVGASAGGQSGDGNPVEEPLKDVVGREPLGVGLVADEDPVAEDVACQRLDVVRGHEVPAVEQGVGTRRVGQGERGPRARP